MSKRTIIVEAYDPNWPTQYQVIKEQLTPIFDELLIDIHHIGSTSIEGLSAKPIIDIIAVVSDIAKVDQLNPQLEACGFTANGEFGMPFRRFFNHSTCNLHVYDQYSCEPQRHLCFRDYLRNHAEERDQYAQLKQRLAQENPYDIGHYLNGKEAFVFGIDKKSGYSGIRMVRPITHSEVTHYETLMGTPPEKNFSLVFFRDTDLVGALLFNQHSDIEKIALYDVADKDELALKIQQLFSKWHNTY